MPAYYTLTSTAPDTPPVALTLPTGWHEVTMATYLRTITPHPTDSLLSILSGLAPDVINQLQADDVTMLCHTIAFALDHTELLELEPSPGLPDVGAQPYGLLAVATAHVNGLDEGVPAIAAGPYLCALYRTHAMFGQMPDKRVTSVEAAILASPVTEVYADSAAFLRGWSNSTSATKRTPTTISNSKMPSSTPASRSWLKGLGLFRRSTV